MEPTQIVVLLINRACSKITQVPLRVRAAERAHQDKVDGVCYEVLKVLLALLPRALQGFLKIP